MSVDVGDSRCEGDTREWSGVGRALLGSVVFRWTGLAVTGDRRGMSVVSSKGVRMMKVRNYQSKGAPIFLYSQLE
jgi:hypothetical protein